MNRLKELKKELAKHADPKRAAALSRFFKTGPGEYGQGDVFEGLTVPKVRAVCRDFTDLSLSEIEELLRSRIHEERLCAVLLLVHKFEKGDRVIKGRVFRSYLANAKQINNWDLVDLSAPRIVGVWLRDNGGSGMVLERLAKDKNLWKRRIAIISTFAFIYERQYIPTFNMAMLLLSDEHDLIHKAVGWMLREVGKRVDRETEEKFLRRHYKRMPRTMLRYAIERFPYRVRKAYLSGLI